jgi:hypothetical protein
MKPILFNTAMVKAILDEKKTMTRRTNKMWNDFCEPLPDFIDNKARTYAIQNYGNREHTDYLSMCEVKMPICEGDILYIREAWWKNNDRYYYLVDYDLPELVKKQLNKGCKCRPSIHMPKEAARIFLKVTNVRVERLQDISFLDALNEGIKPQITEYSGILDHSEIAVAYSISCKKACIDAFHKLWDSTIKKAELDRYGWNSNPYVFVYEFEKCEKPIEEVKE